MINFYLPDFYAFYSINNKLIELTRKNPEFFIPDIKIGSLYGCFPKQIWNGGRVSYGNESADIENIILTIKDLNFKDIPIRFTYTNCLLKEEHLSDEYCNFVTEIANNGKNEILVNSPILEKYLREKYPNYKYISSATRCIRDINKINELIESNDYYLVLGDYRDNFDFDFLSKIKQKDKFEILINPCCSPDCTKRQKHYEILSKAQLGILTEEYKSCENEGLHWYELEKSNHIIYSDDLKDYIDMGFKHFKLEGRNAHPVDLVDSYVYYLVKPEYKDMIRNILLREYFHRV